MTAANTDKMKKATATFSTTLNGGIGSSDTTITLNSTAGMPTDTAVVLVIDATDANGTATPTKKEVVVGVVSGSTITNVTRGKEGTQQSHSSGAVVVDYVTATHWNDVMTALIVDHLQASGNHAIATNYDPSNTTLPTQKWAGVASAVNQLTVTNSATGNPVDLAATGTDSNIDVTITPKGTGVVRLKSKFDGWVTGLTAPSTITALGNRSYTVVVNSTDYTDRLSAGTRLRLTRTVSAPTQSTSLNGTTQYYNKTSPAGMTFTDDFVVSAWVKMAAYNSAAVQVIASRYNGTSGWVLFINTSGQIVLQGLNAGGANYSQVVSYQSIPINKWVHVTAQLDMSAFTNTSTTSYTMFDGVDVPASVSRAGTNPTALIQAGNLEIGSSNGGSGFFNGKIAQVAIYNAHVTQANILATISQTLAGTETSLISAYSFNNSINDLNANANNLTAQASAVATNADSPFGIQADGTISATLEYGIVAAATFSTNTTLTIQVPEGGALPTTGGMSALAYSGVKAPYQMPILADKWRVEAINKVQSSNTSPSLNTWYNLCAANTNGSFFLNIPIGSWNASYMAAVQANGATSLCANITLSTANNSEIDGKWTSYGETSGTTTFAYSAYRLHGISLAAAASYYLNTRFTTAGATSLFNRGEVAATIIRAELAYL